jgi:hypothetical protein
MYIRKLGVASRWDSQTSFYDKRNTDSFIGKRLFNKYPENILYLDTGKISYVD